MQHALLLPQAKPLVGISPPSSPVQQTMDSAALAQATLNAMLEKSPLTPEKQFAVALNVAVLALGRMPGLRMARGRYIKAAVDDFKSKLQTYLPRAGAADVEPPEGDANT